MPTTFQIVRVIGQFATYTGWRKACPSLDYIQFLGGQMGHFSCRRNIAYHTITYTCNPFKYTMFSSHRHMNPRKSFLQLMDKLSMGLQISARLAQLSLLFIPVFLAMPIFIWIIPHRRPFLYKWLYWTLKVAGPCFIKLGQWGATRPDLLPRELCLVFSKLHSNAPIHSMKWNGLAVENAFGYRIKDLFALFDPIPIGSGSVAQVHKAKLFNGLVVAVKICHPRIEELVERDLKLIQFVPNVLDRLLPCLEWLGLSEQANLFATMMRQQLDLRFEAYTLDRFSRNFALNPYISFPQPCYPLVSSSVLVETYQDGIPVEYFYKNYQDPTLASAAQTTPSSSPNSHPHSRETIINPEYREKWVQIQNSIALTGLNSFLKMVLWDNFVHADLHPGNIMIKFVPKRRLSFVLEKFHSLKGSSVRSSYQHLINSQDPNELCRQVIDYDLSPQIVFLDTGLVTELSRQNYYDFVDLFTALVMHGDGYEAGHLMIVRSSGDSSKYVIDPEGFCKEMSNIVTPIFNTHSGSILSLSQFSISPILYQVFDLVRDHHVRLKSSFTNLVMSLICVEGLGRQLSPNINLLPTLIQAGLQYLATSVARSVTDTVEPFL